MPWPKRARLNNGWSKAMCPARSCLWWRSSINTTMSVQVPQRAKVAGLRAYQRDDLNPRAFHACVDACVDFGAGE
jgi:hypothetical protein